MNQNALHSSRGARRQSRFATTQWNLVAAAADWTAVTGPEALEELCSAYWYPLYAYARRSGHAPDDARDLTQGFFARLIEKNYAAQADRTRGRFRTFLLAAFRHFIFDQQDGARRIKRGGGAPLLSLNERDPEGRYQLEPPDPRDPAQLFDRRWAITLLERAMARVEEDLMLTGQGALLDLKPLLFGEPAGETYAQIAGRLNMTPAALKMCVLRLRRRCREDIRREIARTVGTPEDAEEEYRALIQALRS